MTRLHSLPIAGGALLGASLRWGVLEATVTPAAADAAMGLAWPLLALNVVGSFILGATVHPRSMLDHPHLRAAVAAGFCGGLTTFSTFSVELVALTRDGRGDAAVAYGALSVLTAVCAVALGATLAARRPEPDTESRR